MLVLADRAFDGNDLLAAVAGRGAQFLVRLKSTRRPPLAARLCDGSFLSRIGEVVVRIIDADITVTCADGTKIASRYRLATTLLDPRRDSAAALIRLYHERWEIESAYLALRHTLLGGVPMGFVKRPRATYNRYNGVMQMIAELDLAAGRLYYRIRKRKRWREVLSFLKTLRVRWPGEKLYVIADNYSPHKHPQVRAWAADNDVELVFLCRPRPTPGSETRPVPTPGEPRPRKGSPTTGGESAFPRAYW